MICNVVIPLGVWTHKNKHRLPSNTLTANFICIEDNAGKHAVEHHNRCSLLVGKHNFSNKDLQCNLTLELYRCFMLSCLCFLC